MRLASIAHRAFVIVALGANALVVSTFAQGIGEERAVKQHLADGEEVTIPLSALVERGRALFAANWTDQEGAGRPTTDGTGGPLSDPLAPLTGKRSFNRISGPDANSCAGCHNAPHGVVGGGGDFVTNVFVLGQRFDSASFDHNDVAPLGGAVDESGKFVTLADIANSRATLGMFGSGFIEMLSRQMTSDLQSIRDSAPSGGMRVNLVAKGVSFGTLIRNADGTWDTTLIQGLPAPSLAVPAGGKPSLIIRPFHQAGAVVSLRQFSNNAFNHHHGIQTVERFGSGDPDQDGYSSEMTVADVTAVSVFQATIAVPGRVIPNDPAVEKAVRTGEELFVSVGCATCHVPCLPLDNQGWVYTEPNPFNPPGNLLLGDAYVQAHGSCAADLTSSSLPKPRLTPKNGVVYVPAFTDLKLHDITSGPNDENREPLDMQQPIGSPGFFAGNSKFITRKLWGCANEPPYFHHGRFTTLRQAIGAHAGEALSAKAAWDGLSDYGRDSIIEFLKTLQVLPPGTKHLIVDEKGKPKAWPPFPGSCGN